MAIAMRNKDIERQQLVDKYGTDIPGFSSEKQFITKVDSLPSPFSHPTYHIKYIDNAKKFFYKTIEGDSMSSLPVIKRSSAEEIHIIDDFQDWEIEFNTSSDTKQRVSR